AAPRLVVGRQQPLCHLSRNWWSLARPGPWRYMGSGGGQSGPWTCWGRKCEEVWVGREVVRAPPAPRLQTGPMGFPNQPGPWGGGGGLLRPWVLLPTQGLFSCTLRSSYTRQGSSPPGEVSGLDDGPGVGTDVTCCVTLGGVSEPLLSCL
ncbi:hypothetical protein H1C71_015195, partial [Ictidomys tridecemlineatus]